MNANHLPGAQQKRFWQKKWPREVLFNGPPIIVAGSAAVKSWREPLFDQWMFGFATAACIWLALATIVRVATAHAEDQKNGPDVVHEGLYAAVSTVHTMLSEWCHKRNCGGDIRATFHRVVPPIHTGITGRAIRNKKPLVMSSQHGTEEQLRTELVQEWGYTESEARKLGPGRYSAMAIPVLDRSGQYPIGVIYLDSSDRSLFERNDVVEIVGAGTKAISHFVTQRY